MKAALRSSATAVALLLGTLGAVSVAHAQSAPAVYGFAKPALVAQNDNHDRWEQRDNRHRVDHRGPEIFDVTPSHGDRVGARGLTRISARFADSGSGIDMRFLVLRVDGRDVTHRSRLDGDDIRFADDLRPGRHVAELTVRDRAGNSTRRAWSFDVVGRGDHFGYNDAR